MLIFVLLLTLPGASAFAATEIEFTPTTIEYLSELTLPDGEDAPVEEINDMLPASDEITDPINGTDDNNGGDIPPAPAIPVTRIVLPAPPTLNVGTNFTFSPTFTPADFTSTETTVTWTSSVPRVATVNNGGVVTPLDNGTTRITVQAITEGGSLVSASADLTVRVPATSVRFPGARTVDTGRRHQINPVIQPANFNARDTRITWTSSNPFVGTINARGEFSPLRRGSTNITVRVQTTGGQALTATQRVNVRVRATGITTMESLRIVRGRQVSLPAVVQPFDANNRDRRFTSSNTRVIRIDSTTGRMTARNVGTSRITVRSVDGRHVARVTVRVVQNHVRLRNFTLQNPRTERTINIGRSVRIRAIPQPANATNFRPVFTSNNTQVARVDRTGTVTGLRNGSARITVRQGDITRSVVVRVGTLRAQSLTLNRSSAAMVAGESVQLTPTVRPENTNPARIRWSSSDTRVATVDANGRVRAVRDGRATITARTWNNREARVTITVRPFSYVRNVGLRFNGPLVRRANTTGIVLHHTVGNINIQQTHQIHINRGMRGAAYHFLIDRNGVVWQGRPTNMAGGHVRGNLNNRTIGVAWVGNFENERLTPAAKRSGERLIRDILRTHPNITWIHGHRDLRTRIDPNQSATACPGRNFPTQHFRSLLRR